MRAFRVTLVLAIHLSAFAAVVVLSFRNPAMDVLAFLVLGRPGKRCTITWIMNADVLIFDVAGNLAEIV